VDSIGKCFCILCSSDGRRLNTNLQAFRQDQVTGDAVAWLHRAPVNCLEPLEFTTGSGVFRPIFHVRTRYCRPKSLLERLLSSRNFNIYRYFPCKHAADMNNDYFTPPQCLRTPICDSSIRIDSSPLKKNDFAVTQEFAPTHRR
jgi:hypothetical protein